MILNATSFVEEYKKDARMTYRITLQKTNTLTRLILEETHVLFLYLSKTDVFLKLQYDQNSIVSIDQSEAQP